MVESIAIGNTLAELVSERLSSDRRDWWRSTLSAARGGELGATADAFAPAAQKVGTATLHRDVSDRTLVMAQTAAGGLIASWALDEVARATLPLPAGATVPLEDFRRFVEDVYLAGENRERQAILRSLALLPGAAGLLPISLDACRSHVQPLFEAIACDNPYPAAHFPELTFNQMVPKALFVGGPQPAGPSPRTSR